MSSTTVQRMREHIKRNEGVIDTPYRDNKGLLTAGAGFKVDTEDAFAALPFQVKDAKTGQWRDAREDEKRDEFKRVQGMSKDELKRAPSHFKLTPEAIDQKVESEITTRIDKIKGEVGAENWDRLTPGQQTAVLDVHYANGSLKDFPSLKKGIETGNAEEIGRNVDFHSDGSRNWDRLARNRAEAQGTSFEDAKRQVEQEKRAGAFGLEHLRPEPRPQQPEDPPAPEQKQDDKFAPQQPGPGPEAPKPQPISEAEQPADPKVASMPEEQKAPIDPRAAAIAEQAAAPLANPGQAALVKPHQTWTEGEMKDVLTLAQSARSGDPLRARAYEKTQDWHTHVYGDGEQRIDGGKPVEPQALVALPKEPSPPRTPEGEDLYQASGRIGQKVADAVGLDGLANAVKSLQRGLNLLGQQPMPQRSPAWGPYTKQPPLAEDGQYGPKTDFAMKSAVGRFGAPKVENALALGRFNTFARQAQSTGNVDGLESQTHAVFGPLFRDPADTKAPKVEAGVLQETLNGFGHDLKVDNWIGPKTTAAFGQTLRDEDPDTLTHAFGRGLGLF